MAGLATGSGSWPTTCFADGGHAGEVSAEPLPGLEPFRDSYYLQSDFYYQDGIAQQPKIESYSAEGMLAPTLDGAARSLERLLDYCITRWSLDTAEYKRSEGLEQVELWLSSGRPLSLIALDALAVFISRSGQAPIVKRLEPKLKERPNRSTLNRVLQACMAADPAPRVSGKCRYLTEHMDELTID